jgi:EAL domain-containing protein (putative c-di-GMP-specific phosphodiesterase class I)
LLVPSQQRREKDEQRIAELKVDITKIDKALTAEIKRGLERNKAIQVVRDSTRFLMPWAQGVLASDVECSIRQLLLIML